MMPEQSLESKVLNNIKQHSVVSGWLKADGY